MGHERRPGIIGEGVDLQSSKHCDSKVKIFFHLLIYNLYNDILQIRLDYKRQNQVTVANQLWSFNA